jgi:hypothetical protein
MSDLDLNETLAGVQRVVHQHQDEIDELIADIAELFLSDGTIDEEEEWFEFFVARKVRKTMARRRQGLTSANRIQRSVSPEG